MAVLRRSLAAPVKRTNMLCNLHLLRTVAALSVVYFHTTSTAGLNLNWDVGSRGVDIFFVISGFIIAYIGTTKPEKFLRRRLIRIVPFYWAATLFVFAAVTVMPQLFRSTNASIPHLAASLLFIPHASVTGEIQPTLLLGWSLNFEMLFYVLFSLALLISTKWSPLICASWIVAFVFTIHLAATDSVVLNFYGRPIVLEFCYGIGVFYLFRWCSSHSLRIAKVAAFKWILLSTLILSLVSIAVLEGLYRDTIPRYLIAGVPAFFIVASALLLERVYGISANNRLIYLLGESSYVIYLIHPYVVFTMLRVVLKDASALPVAVVTLLIVGLLALTSALAVAIHIVFEKPIMARLRAKFA